LRLEFWTRFQSFFSNLTFSYPDDSVADVGTWARSYAGNSIENLVDLGGNWFDEIERCTDVEVVALAAQDQNDPKKNLDGSSIPGCMSWSRDCSWVWHRLHSYFQGTSVELGRLDTPQTSG